MSNIQKYIGNNVKRKNLCDGFTYYIVLAYSEATGYKLLEPKTDTRINVSCELFEKEFKLCK